VQNLQAAHLLHLSLIFVPFFLSTLPKHISSYIPNGLLSLSLDLASLLSYGPALPSQLPIPALLVLLLLAAIDVFI